MEFFYFLASKLLYWLKNNDSDKQDKVTAEDKDAVTELTKQEKPESSFDLLICPLKEHDLAWQLFHLERRYPEIIKELREDLALADATLKMYVTQFKFKRMSVVRALRSYLRVFWPEDEPEIQALLITHFSRWFLTCKGYSLSFEPGLYKLTCAMLMLNADLNGSNKGRKMTCEEFRANLNNTCGDYTYNQEQLKDIYNSIETRPLTAFIVKTTDQAVGNNEISIPEDSGSNSSPWTVHKTGNLICKQVMDKNGKQTRKGQRAWKSFTAVLNGMDLHLQKDTTDTPEKDSSHTIRLHHAMAYPIEYKNRPHVLCLRTADSRHLYFQAESEAEQTSWVENINVIAARYSAPPLMSASHDIKIKHPLVLPSNPTNLSREQQLASHKDWLQRISGHLDYYQHLPRFDGAISLDYVEQEVKRYTIYVRTLQELVVEEDDGEVSSV